MEHENQMDSMERDFKTEVRASFAKVEKKLDELLHPKTGIHATVAALRNRVETLERFQKIVIWIAGVMSAPILGGLGWGLVSILSSSMGK